jgi:aldehyde:ferredoxin oxidoreductase
LGQALAYGIVDRGADHNRIWCMDFFTSPQKASPSACAELAFRHQCYRSACDLLGVCRFVSYQINFDLYARMLSAATGWHISESDIISASEMVFNLTRAFNLRQGLTAQDDSAPARCFDEPVPSGPTKGSSLKREDFHEALKSFYVLSGWDERTGVPTRNKLKELGLEDIAEDLEKV